MPENPIKCNGCNAIIGYSDKKIKTRITCSECKAHFDYQLSKWDEGAKYKDDE
jgi:hypothetical protein